MSKFIVLAFYQFIERKDLDEVESLLKKKCIFSKIKGTILLSSEGINGTVSGSEKSILELSSYFKEIGYGNLNEKLSSSKFLPFPRLKVRIKDEIVTFKEDLDLINNRGEYIDAAKWNDLIDDPELILVDVRNDFEVQMGSFEKAENPDTKSFTDFKKYAEEKLLQNKNTKVAMFCTGGIRCEKASSYLVGQGMKNVYQLKGGILSYLEKIDESSSKWKGECFVFDRRVSIKTGLKEGTYKICSGCRNPINDIDRESELFEEDVSCKNCFNKTSNSKKNGLRERAKQTKLARERGKKYPYLEVSADEYFESGF
ncbi:MAG: rhodanese-related sulfurtransferase [Chloroflexota bacterium]|nr:rhodanese-related sulfurtransferase [Chloroflexota bacterium]